LDIFGGGKRECPLDILHEGRKLQSFFALVIAFFAHFFQIRPE
jgi:hypothetical protein